jgi:hypothetical protein
MTFAGLVNNFLEILKWVVILGTAVALISFLMGLVGYLINSGDEAKRKDSIAYMITGIIGLTVIVGLWGIVSIIMGTFGSGLIIIPQI